VFPYCFPQQFLALTLEEIEEFELAEESDAAKYISGCAFSPAGEYIAAATDSGFIKVRVCLWCGVLKVFFLKQIGIL